MATDYFDPSVWTAITALLKGVKDAPVARRSQANRFSWLDELNRAAVGKVLWFVDVQDSIEEVWANDSQTYRYPLAIVYFRISNLSAAEIAANTTIEAAIESKLADARDAFVYYTGTAFQLAGNLPTRSISDSNPANDVLFQLQDRFMGGGFEVSPLVGFYP